MFARTAPKGCRRGVGILFWKAQLQVEVGAGGEDVRSCGSESLLHPGAFTLTPQIPGIAVRSRELAGDVRWCLIQDAHSSCFKQRLNVL